MKNTFALFLILLLPATAAAPRRYRYYRTVSAATSKVTVRQADGTSSRPLHFDGAWFKSSAACAASMTVGGTVSGGTTVAGASVPKLDTRSPSSSASIILDGTVSGAESPSAWAEASTTTNTLGGGLHLKGGTTSQFTLSWSCGASQTLEIVVHYNEDSE